VLIPVQRVQKSASMPNVFTSFSETLTASVTSLPPHLHDWAETVATIIAKRRTAFIMILRGREFVESSAIGEEEKKGI
jgi:hypothetical protein